MNKNVVVIGGGIAGLGAAAELLRQDCQVTLLEAAPRLGGRIQTTRVSTTVIELGAEFLHGENLALQAAIQAAGLSTTEVSLRNKIFQDGNFISEDVWSKMAKIIHRIDPRKEDSSFEDFLEREIYLEWTREMAVNFVNGFHAAHVERLSAHSLRRAEYAAEHMVSTKQNRLDAGYGALVDFIADDIQKHGGKILTGAEVKKINWQRDGVEIEFKQNEKTEIVNADAAIVTVSLGVLKSDTIEFHPPLTKKREAIEQLQFGNVVKIALLFNDKWWPDFSFIQAWDEVLPTWWTDPRNLVLTAWAGGPQADALKSFSHTQLEAVALATLKKIFPREAQAMQSSFISSHYHDWTQDPHVRGAYSYIPVNGLDLPKLLAEPLENTLFFAGEATVFDAQTGMVSEAYDTGLRAARELCA